MDSCNRGKSRYLIHYVFESQSEPPAETELLASSDS